PRRENALERLESLGMLPGIHEPVPDTPGIHFPQDRCGFDELRLRSHEHNHLRRRHNTIRHGSGVPSRAARNVRPVICSDTSPTRKMITAALNSRTLMFVNRPAVAKV